MTLELLFLTGMKNMLLIRGFWLITKYNHNKRCSRIICLCIFILLTLHLNQNIHGNKKNAVI